MFAAVRPSLFWACPFKIRQYLYLAVKQLLHKYRAIIITVLEDVFKPLNQEMGDVAIRVKAIQSRIGRAVDFMRRALDEYSATDLSACDNRAANDNFNEKRKNVEELYLHFHSNFQTDAVQLPPTFGRMLEHFIYALESHNNYVPTLYPHQPQEKVEGMILYSSLIEEAARDLHGAIRRVKEATNKNKVIINQYSTWFNNWLNNCLNNSFSNNWLFVFGISAVALMYQTQLDSMFGLDIFFPFKSLWKYFNSARRK